MVYGVVAKRAWTEAGRDHFLLHDQVDRRTDWHAQCLGIVEPRHHFLTRTGADNAAAGGGGFRAP